MLNDKFLNPEEISTNDTDISENNDCCDSTPLNNVFMGGCCLIIIINVTIATLLYCI